MALPQEAIEEMKEHLENYLGNFNTTAELARKSKVGESTIRRLRNGSSKTISHDNAVQILNVICTGEQKNQFAKAYLPEFRDFFKDQDVDAKAMDNRIIMKPLNNLIWNLVCNGKGSTVDLLVKNYGSAVYQSLEELKKYGVRVDKCGKVVGPTDWKLINLDDRLEQIALYTKHIRQERLGEDSVAGYHMFDACDIKVKEAFKVANDALKALEKLAKNPNTSTPTNVIMFGTVFANFDNC